MQDTNNEWQKVSQLESDRVMEIIALERKNKKLVEALEDIELECNKGQDNIKKSNNHHDGMIYGLGHLQQIKDYIHLFSKYLALNEVNNEK